MKSLKSLTIFAFAALLLVPNVYGYFSYNLTCKIFPDQCGGEGLTIADPPLDQLIIEAAGYYMKSDSDYRLFLREFELSGSYGTNFATMQELVNNAIENMHMANSLYFQVWQTSKTLEYDPVILEKLHQFDYYSFQVKKHLNPAIFEKVALYLKNGDVRGTYKKAYHATGKILHTLEFLKISLDKNKLPEIETCWRLNQLFLETLLFGQNISEVFFAIAVE